MLAPETPAALTLIPKPTSLRIAKSAPFEASTKFVLENRAHFASAKFLSDELAARSVKQAQKGDHRIVFVKRPGPAASYDLVVSPARVLVSAADDAGAFYAVQTIFQLMGPAKGKGAKLPSVSITDQPRFSWRGMHLDVSRHFFSVDFVKRYIDWLASYKMNVFHWHLVDDGGWRMESKAYPLLTQKGAWRLGKAGEWNYSNIVFPDSKEGKQVYGGFYTQNQIKEVIAYAAKKHVSVVPEIEMPGHCQPAIACYPDLGCRLPDRRINNVFCPGSPKAMAFLKEILDETAALFPSKYIHIGADEVDRSDWARCPDCQALMKKEGLKDGAELQSWFVRQMDEHLRSRGRILIGWDEILDGGLAPGAVVMSWRGFEGGAAAAKAGRKAIMSPTSHCYFDYSYDSIPSEKVYAFNPIPAGLTPDQEKLILGGQANVWTEWIPTEAKAQQMIFPRMLGLAEVLWSKPEGRSWAEFEPRLAAQANALRARGAAVMPPSPPHSPVTAVLFGRGIEMTMPSSPDPAMPLRWTTPGKPLTPQSPLLPKVFKTTKSVEIQYGYADKNGAVSPLEVISLRPAQTTTAGAMPGWNLIVQPGDFSLTPKRPATGTPIPVEGVDLAQAPSKEYYALHFYGTIALEAGDYQFRLSSDDGSVLRVGGAVVVNHDGLHAPSAKVGTVRLPKGVYPIELSYFQKGGAASLSLEYAKTGGEWRRVDSAIVRR